LGKGSRLAPLAYASDSQLTVAFDLWHKLLGLFKRLEEISTKEFEDIYRVNVQGPWLLTKLLMPVAKQFKAMVVMVSSDVSTRTFPNGGAYTASKFALRAITRTFQQENPELRFLELRPGAIDSYFAGSKQGDADKHGFLQTTTVAESLRAVLRLPAEARVEEVVLRSRDQAIEY
jgi:NADP-dependent 3-hydroxy acid dehydrogenase YdfG